MSTDDRHASRTLKDIEDHLKGNDMSGSYREHIDKLYATAGRTPPGGPVVEDELTARDALASEAMKSLLRYREPDEVTPALALSIAVAGARVADAWLHVRTLPPCEFDKPAGPQPKELTREEMLDSL